MDTEITDNKVIRIPQGAFEDQYAPVYVLGLPSDVEAVKRILNNVDIGKLNLHRDN